MGVFPFQEALNDDVLFIETVHIPEVLFNEEYSFFPLLRTHRSSSCESLNEVISEAVKPEASPENANGNLFYFIYLFTV